MKQIPTVHNEARSKVETTRARLEQARAKETELTRGSGPAFRPLEHRVDLAEAEIEHLRALDDLAAAAHQLRDELAVSQLRDGDPDAIGADLATLAEGLRGDLDEIEALEEQVRGAYQRAAERVADARQAETALAARRAADGLPAPVAIPTPRQGQLADNRPASMIAAIEKAMMGEAPAPKHQKAIERLTREADAVRVEIETQRREREERARARLAAEKESERQNRELAAENSRAHKEWLARMRAEKDRERDLADAHRARTEPV